MHQASLVLTWRVRLHLPILAHDHEVALIVLEEGAVFEHLTDEFVCNSGLRMILLQLLNLALEDVILGQLGRFLHLFLLGSRLLVGDLLLGALALAAGLQEVGGRALGG